MDVEENFVPRYFQMDPETEDLLFDGLLLQDGMVVLIEDANYRSLSARKYNRWCTVRNLRIKVGDERDSIEFIGEYEDRTKQKFILPAKIAWYVKLDSIPQDAPEIEFDGITFQNGTDKNSESDILDNEDK